MEYPRRIVVHLTERQRSTLRKIAHDFNVTPPAYLRMMIGMKPNVGKDVVNQVLRADASRSRYEFSVTEIEYITLKELSSIHGLSQSDFVRCLIHYPTESLDRDTLGLDETSEVLTYTRKELHALYRELNRQGHNLNQATYGINLLAKEGDALDYPTIKLWCDDIKILLDVLVVENRKIKHALEVFAKRESRCV